MMDSKPSLLLQACCAPCAAWPYQQLQPAYRVTVLFYNPNIHPASEYDARLREIEAWSRRRDFPLLTGPCDDARWFELTRGLETEPEGGERCRVCFRMRLEYTARLAAEKGFDMFTTALSVSPHKNAGVINSIGRDIAARGGPGFLEADFKKKDGFKISCRISREEGFYRQNYCGCVYSRGPEQHP